MTSAPSGRVVSAPVNPAIAVALLLPAVVVYVAIFVFAMQHFSYDIWGAIWVAPVLIAISVPILMRFARGEPNPRIGYLLIAALVLKLAASFPRYYMVVYLYETGDSLRYADTARVLRQDFLNLNFSLTTLGPDSRSGTEFIEIVTGAVYTLIGPSFIGGFVFFSWLSFWGLFFFYRAFRVAIPDGDKTRYAVLLFLLPSMLFWPSSIGKEAWMTLMLGLTAYGGALLLARERGATFYLLPGLVGVLAVRPHVALLVVAALGLAYLIRGRGAQRGIASGRLRTVLGVSVIAVATLFLIRRVTAYFGIDEFSLESAAETLEYAEGQSAQGGSAFNEGAPSFSNLPVSLVTVLFRPFLFEAHNIQALLTAIEGTVLLLLFVLSWPRLRSIPRRLRKQPYITFCVTYTVLFCFVFSAFQNFGLLARERVMVYPFVLVLLALPAATAAARSDRRPEPYSLVATRE